MTSVPIAETRSCRDHHASCKRRRERLSLPKKSLPTRKPMWDNPRRCVLGGASDMAPQKRIRGP